jgi:hypothetical protein
MNPARLHTPGPWRVSDVGAVVADVPIDGGPDGSDDVEHYGGHLIAESVAPCNRPLIAAAPKLLSALRELNRAWNATSFPCSDRMDAALKDADDAIAEAEGR